ncbi:MAG: beta strand repeat-containing protein, partial [Isosphaeraceae bacterium]
MNVFGKAGRRGRGRDRKRTTQIGLELFEQRTLLTGGTYQVTLLTDNPTTPATHSLRWAINQADGNPGSTITFAIPSPYTISLAAALPPISQSTTIDGTSQLTASSTPQVVIDGTAITTAGASGFDLQSGSSTVKGLDIVGFNQAGDAAIKLESNGNQILQNYIGVGPDGVTAGPGNAIGVLVTGSNNVIGGSGTANTIGQNTSDGISVASGTGNVVSQNTYAGSNGTASPIQANDIVLGSVTNPQAAPTLVQANFDPTTNQLTVEAYATGPTSAQQVLEVYLVTAGQRSFVSSKKVQLSTSPASPTSVVFNLTPSQVAGIAAGSSFAATLTDPTDGTSKFSAAVTIQGANVVTSTADTGQYGSLSYAINYVTQNSGYTNIVFAIPVTSGATSVTLDESGVTLPPIPAGITIDGSTESQNVGQSVGVIIDGGNQAANGLTLSGSDTVENLTIQDFTGAGIVISAKGNTVAGNTIKNNNIGVSISATATTGNQVISSTIGPNKQYGVDVASGSGTVVSQNTYSGSNGTASPVQANDIVVAAGITNRQTPPTLLTASDDPSYATALVVQVEATPVTSSAPQTLEVYTVTSSSSRTLVATAQVTGLSASSPTAVYLSLVTGATLSPGDQLAATLTDSTGGTSAFSASVSISPGSVVTTKADDGPGSLRSAIDYAAVHSGTTITFAIPGTGPFVIPVGSSTGTALPNLPAGTVVDGSTEAGVVLSNGGGVADGLTLPNGTDKVLGLSIQGFNVGILVESSSNTIGGTSLGAGDTIGSSANDGIFVASGTGNTISQDTYTGSNGPASPVQANDIVLGSGVTNPEAPDLLSASYDSSSNKIVLQVAGTASTSNQTLEVYLVTNTQRTFIGTAQVTLSATPSFVEVTPSVAPQPGEVLAATITDPTNGTSPFSGSATIAAGNVVTSEKDGEKAGSLSYAINYVATNPKYHSIIFAVPVSPGATSVTLDESGVTLPPIPAGITIDGSTESQSVGQSVGVIIDGGNKAANGLTLAGSNTVENLTIQNFTGAGIVVASSGNTVVDDVIQNNSVGVSITGANNVIGGLSSRTANTIGSNTSAGIWISGSTATGNLIGGNDIGTDANGHIFGNAIGIFIDTPSSANNTIGGTVTGGAGSVLTTSSDFGPGNTIGLTSGDIGIQIAGSGTNLVVQGNFIGTNLAGKNMVNNNDTTKVVTGIQISGA